MFVRQSKNSYIRTTPHYGYITNQLTRHDRVYDESGAEFLNQISRIPKNVEDAVGDLLNVFKDVDGETLSRDFEDFIKDLADDGFVVIDESIEQLDLKDPDFTYSIDNPKTLRSDNDFYQQTAQKVSENTQDFFLEKVQGKPMISSLQLELSSRCNERCIHCYIPNEKKGNGIDMPWPLVKKLLDEFAEMGGIDIILSGGEALLHRDIQKILKYCRSKDLKISVLSNLINITDEDIKVFKETNVSLVQTSLYSMDEDIHDSITTVKGSFKRTKAAIEKLVDADVPVQISCPLMKANRSGYKEVLKYAHSLKIKAQTDYIMMAQANLDTSNLSNRLSLEETEQVINDIIDYDFDYLRSFEKTKPITEEMAFDLERFKSQPVCGVGYDNCCVTANGDVYPCAGWQDYVLGNVCHSTLKDIWEQSDKIKQLRTITQASFPQCLECEARQFCARCLVRNYNENNGEMLTVNKHFCDVAFLNKRLVEERYGDKMLELRKLFSK